MFVRCAYFVGDVAPENRARFDSHFDDECIPIIATFPNLRSYRLLRARWHEEGALGVYMTLELTFDGPEDIETMLASEARARNVEKLKEVMPLFEGKVFHINYEVGANG